MSQSCVSCKFLQVRTFNSSLSPRQLSDGVPEDQEHNGNPNARYVVLRWFSKVQLWGFKIYCVISIDIA